MQSIGCLDPVCRFPSIPTNCYTILDPVFCSCTPRSFTDTLMVLGGRAQKAQVQRVLSSVEALCLGDLMAAAATANAAAATASAHQHTAVAARAAAAVAAQMSQGVNGACPGTSPPGRRSLEAFGPFLTGTAAAAAAGIAGKPVLSPSPPADSPCGFFPHTAAVQEACLHEACNNLFMSSGLASFT